MSSNFGLCLCGCGETTPIAKLTDKRRGYKKGEHTKYRPGHLQRTQGKAMLVMQPSTSTEITVADIERLREGDDQLAADTLDKRSREIERMAKRSFAELGLIGLEMDQRQLWSKLVHPETGVAYHSWEDWATSVFKVSRNTVFTAKRLVKATQDNIPIEDLKDMTRQNLTQLAKLSPKVQKRVVEKAKNYTEDEFIDHIKENHPEQHVEKSPKLVQNFADPNNRKYFDQAVEIAQWAYEVESREDAIANIMAYFLDGLCERQGYVKQTNRDAFKMAKKRGDAA